MSTAIRHIAKATGVAGCALVGLMALGLSSTTARAPVEQPFPPIAMTADARTSQPNVQDMFADAPDGVDPVVTGPVSAAFKTQQELAGCKTAAWPNIPTACFPNR